MRKGNPLSLKRHLFLHGDRAKKLAQGFLDLFFDAAPHLEDYFQFFELSCLSTKAAFAKAAFDTLRTTLVPVLGIPGASAKTTLLVYVSVGQLGS